MKIATTKERIVQYLEFKGIKISQFYATTGLKRGLLDSDKLKQNISDSFVAIIIGVYSDLNIEWLITGQGPMLKEADIEKRDSEAKEMTAETIELLNKLLKQTEIAERLEKVEKKLGIK